MRLKRTVAALIAGAVMTTSIALPVALNANAADADVKNLTVIVKAENVPAGYRVKYWQFKNGDSGIGDHDKATPFDDNGVATVVFSEEELQPDENGNLKFGMGIINDSTDNNNNWRGKIVDNIFENNDNTNNKKFYGYTFGDSITVEISGNYTNMDDYTIDNIVKNNTIDPEDGDEEELVLKLKWDVAGVDCNKYMINSWAFNDGQDRFQGSWVNDRFVKFDANGVATIVWKKGDLCTDPKGTDGNPITPNFDNTYYIGYGLYVNEANHQDMEPMTNGDKDPYICNFKADGVSNKEDGFTITDYGWGDIVNAKIVKDGADTTKHTLGEDFLTNFKVVLTTEHIHVAKEIGEYKAPTCTTPGQKAYYFCSCKTYFQDSSLDETKVFADKDATVIPVDPTNHKLTHYEANAPTDCTTNGNIEYWECEDCHKKFDAATGGNEITNIVDPAKHTPVKHVAKNATCTEDGNIQYWQCSACKKCFEEEACETEIEEAKTVIKAKHDPQKVDAVAATCKKAGNIEYYHCEKCGKDYKTDKCVLELSAEDIEDPIDLDNTKQHDWGVWETVTPATETEGGVMKRTCKRDDLHFETKTTMPTSHKHTAKEEAHEEAATCTEPGWEKHYHCASEGCDKVFLDKECQEEVNKGTLVIPAKGHDPDLVAGSLPTCTEDGKEACFYCPNCKTYFSDNKCKNEIAKPVTISKLGHDLEKIEAIAATCAASGIKEHYHCKNCEKYFDTTGTKEISHESIVDPKKTTHTWSKWETVVEATANATGLEKRTCSVCHKVETRIIGETGHELGLHHEKLDPTCTTQGWNEHWHCKICGRSFSDETLEHEMTDEEVFIPANGHTESTLPAVAATCTKTGLTEGKECSVCHTVLVPQKPTKLADHKTETISAKEPTCTEVGNTEGTKCSVCGKIIKATTPRAALGHDWDDGELTTPPTADTPGEITFTCKRGCGTTKTEDTASLNHTHSGVIFVKPVNPDCEHPGNIAYWYCPGCRSNFKDAAMTTLVADVTRPATGHAEVTDPEEPATCTTSGLTEGSHCENCGHIFTKQTVSDPLGHNWDEAHPETETAATCEYGGANKINCLNCDEYKFVVTSALGHDYMLESDVKATCTTDGTKVEVCRRANCSDRKTTTTNKTGHSYTATETTTATCTENGHEELECGVCHDKKTVITAPKTGHSYSETATRPATCTKNGEKDLECGNCHDKKTIITEPMIGHSYSETATRPATCTKNGEKDLECGNCHDKKTIITESATGHDYEVVEKVAPTYNANGYELNRCTKCGDEYKTTLPALNHNYVLAEKKNATCEEDGYEVYRCTDCNDEFTNVLPLLGHDYKVTEKVAATCEADGYELSVCANCGDELKIVTLTPGHDYKVTEKVDPTCKADGYELNHCANCGVEFTKVLPTPGHNWGEGQTTTEPTGTTDGEMTYVCADCGETKTEVIPATADIISSSPETSESPEPSESPDDSTDNSTVNSVIGSDNANTGIVLSIAPAALALSAAAVLVIKKKK